MDEIPPLELKALKADSFGRVLLMRGTPFLRLAQQNGVQRLADGVGMLVEQAAEAFDWWRGVRPETAAVIGQLTVALR